MQNQNPELNKDSLPNEQLVNVTMCILTEKATSVKKRIETRRSSAIYGATFMMAALGGLLMSTIGALIGGALGWLLGSMAVPNPYKRLPERLYLMSKKKQTSLVKRIMQKTHRLDGIVLEYFVETGDIFGLLD